MADASREARPELADAMIDAADVALAAYGTDGGLLRANADFGRLRNVVACGAASFDAIDDVIRAWRSEPFELRRLDVEAGGRVVTVTARHVAAQGHVSPFLLVTMTERPSDAGRSSDLGPGEWMLDALDSVPHKIWVVEPEGRALYANTAIADYLGQRLPGDRASRDAMIFHPDDQGELERVRAASAPSRTNFSVHLRVRRHDGAWRWHHLTVTRLFSDDRELWLVLATDVHELRLATDKLRVTEERLTLAQAVGRIGIWDWRIETNEMAVNPVFHELVGRWPGPLGGLAEFLATVHEADRAAVASAFETAIAADTGYQFEYRVQRGDGVLRWMSARGGVVRDESGKPVRLLGVLSDITEAREAALDRERLMRQIADQLQELEQLYDTAPIGLAMLDRDLRFQRINKRLADINGHSVEDHLGRRAWDLVPDLEATAGPMLRRVLATGVALNNVEISGETPATKGVRHWVEQFYPLGDSAGGIRGIGVICEEVTDRKRAERRLRASEERLRLAADAAKIGVFEWDPENDTSVFVNSHMRELFGADQSLSRTAFLDTFVHPDDRDPVSRAFEARSLVPGRTVRITCRVRRGDSWRHIEFAGEFSTSDDGSPKLRFLGIARDVTAIKHAEETQRLLIGELNHRVKNTLATVQAIASQTLRRAKTPDEFVASLTGRLHALSHAHNLLTETTWSGADLSRLVREQLVIGAATDPRVAIAGDVLILPPQTALRLGLVIHELGTNARKHGALSAAAGHLHVGWHVARVDDRPWLELHWRERGGPPVAPPDHRGFGTRLIEASLSALGGNAVLDYAREGLDCHLRLPIT
jgi:PAS domain S-box-containing protein